MYVCKNENNPTIRQDIMFRLTDLLMKSDAITIQLGNEEIKHYFQCQGKRIIPIELLAKHNKEEVGIGTIDIDFLLH